MLIKLGQASWFWCLQAIYKNNNTITEYNRLIYYLIQTIIIITWGLLRIYQ